MYGSYSGGVKLFVCEDVQLDMCVLAWCLMLCAASVGNDGWLCACEGLCAAPLEGEESIAGKIWQPTRKYVRHRFNVALRTDCCWLCSCASCSDDGWLCACLQSPWKGKDPLQARGAAKGLIGHSHTAAQMSLVAHELLLDALLAGMVAGCVLACVQHLLVWVEAKSSLNQAQAHSQPSPENTLAS